MLIEIVEQGLQWNRGDSHPRSGGQHNWPKPLPIVAFQFCQVKLYGEDRTPRCGAVSRPVPAKTTHSGRRGCRKADSDTLH